MTISYDEWIRVMVAVKAATSGSEEGFAAFDAWSARSSRYDAEVTRQKWDSFRPPYAIGFPYLAQLADEHSGGKFNRARFDFDAVDVGHCRADDTPRKSSGDPEERRIAAEAAMFARYVWAERLEAAVDRTDGTLLSKQPFNARNYEVGDPSSASRSAWGQFLKQGDRRRSVRSVTYRPGKGAFVQEEEGECVNTWRAPPPLPAESAGADATPWLEHMAYLIPNETERETLLSWMAWVIQHPDQKPNWGVLVGGAHGIGKSTMLEPMRLALGARNVREIGPTDLASGFTGWLAETKLLVVEEMHSFERKETMQRLKGFLATPPYTLQVNPKFGKAYELPNIVAGVFFTNHENALALERGDRRFYVLWSEAEPRESAYYASLMAWYSQGGAAAAAQWLLARDVSKFDAKGRAPDTEAKEAMRQQSRSLLDEKIEDAIAYGEGPFAAKIVRLDEVRDWILADGAHKGVPLTGARLSAALRKAGARSLGQVWLENRTVRTRLFTTKENALLEKLSHGDLLAAYEGEAARLRDKQAARLKEQGF